MAGPCKAAVVSWYFNSDRKRCEQFIYGGCRGNANRFPTREECETKCHELRTHKEVGKSFRLILKSLIKIIDTGRYRSLLYELTNFKFVLCFNSICSLAQF